MAALGQTQNVIITISAFFPTEDSFRIHIG